MRARAKEDVPHRCSPLIPLLALVGACALPLPSPTHAQPSASPAWDQGVVAEGPVAVLPQRERVDAINRMLEDRLENLLPQLMRETGIEMWLVINREYNEDPVYLSLVPAPVFAARRTTMLVFHDRGPEQGVEKFTVSRYPLGQIYVSAWEGGNLEEQWQRLGEIIAERKPASIGINTSTHWAFGDGLSHGLYEQLRAVSGDVPLVSAEELCIRWLETRTQMELEAYPHIVRLARSVIAEAFSSRVITPGVTTTTDVAWYIRQRYSDLGLPIWFMPYVNAQRKGTTYENDKPFFGESDVVIQRGDVLHTDVGIRYLRLNTDNQEMGYVLRLGEQDVPAGLKHALSVGNRWQDLLTQSFVTGRTGNEILAAARKAAESEGIVCSVYTHPLGFHGHGAGPTIGMWDNQGRTPERGDWKLHPNTAYAIEGNVKVPVPEWDGQWVQIKMEQGAFFDGSSVRYLGGRQTEWHVVR